MKNYKEIYEFFLGPYCKKTHEVVHLGIPEKSLTQWWNINHEEIVIPKFWCGKTLASLYDVIDILNRHEAENIIKNLYIDGQYLHLDESFLKTIELIQAEREK